MQVTILNPEQMKSIKMILPKPDQRLTRNMEIIGITEVIPMAVLSDVFPEDSPLARLKGKRINVDELNFLARRLESLTGYEEKKFAACCEVRVADNLKDMINLTYNLGSVSLVDDYRDLAAIGKRIYLDVNTAITEEEMKRIDFEQYAREYMQKTVGISTVYGTLLPGDFKNWQTYEGGVFPEFYDDKKTVMGILIKNEFGDQEHLYLPMDIHSMNKAKARLGVKWFSECEIVDFYNLRLPGGLLSLIKPRDIEDLTLLNELCSTVCGFTDSQMEQLQMAAEFTGAGRITALTGLAKHLDRFVIFPGIHNDTEYGRYLVEESGMFDVDEVLLPFIDYGALGQNEREVTMMESGFVPGGYVGATVYTGDMLDYAGGCSELLETMDELPALRLFSPLHGICYINGGDSVPIELDGSDLAMHKDKIKKLVGEQVSAAEKTRGLMIYLGRDRSLDIKIHSAFPTVEEHGGVLYGVLECRLKEPLDKAEMEVLKEAWLGQMSDGWGESFEQQEIKIDNGTARVSFWNRHPDYCILTESELKGIEEVQQEVIGQAMNQSS